MRIVVGSGLDMLSGTCPDPEIGNLISLPDNQHGNGPQSSPPTSDLPSHGDPRKGRAQPHSYMGEGGLVFWTTKANQPQIYCFNQDRCMAAQLGKPITIQEDPSLLSHMEFLKRSQYALPHDAYGSPYTALLRIVSGFREVFAHTCPGNSSDSSIDIRALAFQTDIEILHCQHETLESLEYAGGWSLHMFLRTQPQQFHSSSGRFPHPVHGIVRLNTSIVRPY